jgi:AcrR family transcriptional regulator
MDTAPVHDHLDLWEEIQPASSRRMLLAALEEFAARGYYASTTRDICRRAGVSPAGIYAHYASKVDLLYELTRIGHVAVLQEVQDALVGVEGPVERLRQLMQTFVEWHARNHTLARVIQYEIRAIPPERFDPIRRPRKGFQDLLADELRQGVAAGAFVIADLQTTKVALLSMGIDVARWWTPRAMPPAELGKAYGEIALRILGATPSV